MVEVALGVEPRPQMVERGVKMLIQVKCVPSRWLGWEGIVDIQSRNPYPMEWYWAEYIVMHQIVASVESAFEMVVAFV